MSRPGRLKLAIVVPRFGESVSGGAELLGKWLAERLAAGGDQIDVYTTCALDHRTWKNELPAGAERHGPVTVRRFPVRERDLGIHGELDLAVQKGAALSDDEEFLWLRHGCSSEEMEVALVRHGPEYDAVIALPYLFGTTYFAFEASPQNFVLIPCVHDELYAHLRCVRRMLAGAFGLIFNTDAEAALARRLEPAMALSAVVGVGVELEEGAPAAPRRRRASGLSILYAGRREAGKNTPLLIDYFMLYKERRPSDLRLVFAGAGDPVPDQDDIVEVPPDWRGGSVYRDATVFCQPGINESFSIVLLQAWLAKCPALVHGDCAVTKQHCERSNGGLWFRSYAEFEEVVDMMLDSPDLCRQLGRNGRRYVETEYSWDVVLGRFHAAMERLLSSERAVTKLASDPA